MNWSYIAGYFDGEGHVSFHKNRRSDWERTAGLCWVNTNRESIEAMRVFMKCGSISIRPGTNKPIYALSITRRTELLRIGKKMLPHLIVKKDATAEMLDWISANRKNQHKNWGFSATVSPDELRSLYVDQKHSTATIAKKFGVAAALIQRLLRQHGIGMRANGGGHMKGIPKSAKTVRRMKAARRKMWLDPEFRDSQIAMLQNARRLAQEARA